MVKLHDHPFHTCAFSVFTVTKAVHTRSIDVLWIRTPGTIPEAEGGVGTFSPIETDDPGINNSTFGSTATINFTGGEQTPRVRARKTRGENERGKKEKEMALTYSRLCL